MLWIFLGGVGCSLAGSETVNAPAADSLAAAAKATIVLPAADATEITTESVTAIRVEITVEDVLTTLPPPTTNADVGTESDGQHNDLLPSNATGSASQTPSPAASQTRNHTATPVSTATSTTTPTMTPPPSPVPVERRCPNPAPSKPEYNHFWLSSRIWPTPAPTPETHFWLSKPLPGGGRLITSQILPYGFDGLGRYLLHNGADMAEPMGTPVLAVADGTVIVAQSDEQELYGWRCNWYGHLVVIQLDETWQDQPLFALYGHIVNMVVAPGERVVRGQQVAEVGIGGAAIAPHLHFELRVGENSFNATRNPLLWLSPGETRGVIAGRLIDPEGRPWQGQPVQIRRIGPADEAEVPGTEGESPAAEGSDTMTAWTYLDDPQHIIHPDEGFAENFVLSDLRPGVYEVLSTVQGETYRGEVEVFAGSVSAVELKTQPFKTPTPTP